MKILIMLVLILSFGAFAQTNVVLTEENSVIMNEQFDSSSCERVIKKMNNLIHKAVDNDFNKRPTLYLVLNSPGGSINDGLLMIDVLNSLPATIHTITIEAASMGFITAQLMGKRYIIAHGVMMSHKAKTAFREFLELPGQIDARINFWKKRIENIDNLIVKRTNGVHSLKSYNALMENEYWCEGQDCIDQGFADEIIGVTCNSSLMKTEKVQNKYSLFGVSIDINIKKSMCPIIKTVDEEEIMVNGKKYKYDNSVVNNFLKQLKKNRFNSEFRVQ